MCSYGAYHQPWKHLSHQLQWITHLVTLLCQIWHSRGRTEDREPQTYYHRDEKRRGSKVKTIFYGNPIPQLHSNNFLPTSAHSSLNTIILTVSLLWYPKISQISHMKDMEDTKETSAFSLQLMESFQRVSETSFQSRSTRTEVVEHARHGRMFANRTYARVDPHPGLWLCMGSRLAMRWGEKVTWHLGALGYVQRQVYVLRTWLPVHKYSFCCWPLIPTPLKPLAWYPTCSCSVIRQLSFINVR